MGDERLFPATLMPDRDWWQVLWPNPAQVVAAIGIDVAMSVLDLGCGDGYFTAAIARQVGVAGHVTGFDLDPQMLEQAKKTCEGLPALEWVAGDAMELSRIITKPVDYVLMANTFHGVGDRATLVHEVRAILKPSGWFGIINWHTLPREETLVLGLPRGPATTLRLSPEETRAAVEPLGFRLDEQIELPPYHYGVRFARN